MIAVIKKISVRAGCLLNVKKLNDYCAWFVDGYSGSTVCFDKVSMFECSSVG